MEKKGIAISWEWNHQGIICKYYNLENGCFKWWIFIDYTKREILQKLRQRGISVNKTIERNLYKI